MLSKPYFSWEEKHFLTTIESQAFTSLPGTSLTIPWRLISLPSDSQPTNLGCITKFQLKRQGLLWALCVYHSWSLHMKCHHTKSARAGGNLGLLLFGSCWGFFFVVCCFCFCFGFFCCLCNYFAKCWAKNTWVEEGAQEGKVISPKQFLPLAHNTITTANIIHLEKTRVGFCDMYHCCTCVGYTGLFLSSSMISQVVSCKCFLDESPQFEVCNFFW